MRVSSPLSAKPNICTEHNGATSTSISVKANRRLVYLIFRFLNAPYHADCKAHRIKPDPAFIIRCQTNQFMLCP